jgi:hypothetical protein
MLLIFGIQHSQRHQRITTIHRHQPIVTIQATRMIMAAAQATMTRVRPLILAVIIAATILEAALVGLALIADQALTVAAVTAIIDRSFLN